MWVKLRVNWRQRLKGVLVIVGWAFGIAVFILKALYENPLAFRYYLQNPVYSGLSLLNLVFIFIISVIAGIVLVKPESILIGCAGSLALSGLMVFIVLSQPAFVADAPEAVRELMFFRSVSIIFRMLVPTVIVLNFLGGVLGGIVGERF